MTDRARLHAILDKVPESRLPAAHAALSALALPADDEPVTSEEAEALRRSEQESRDGKLISHEEILKDFGLA